MYFSLKKVTLIYMAHEIPEKEIETLKSVFILLL